MSILDCSCDGTPIELMLQSTHAGPYETIDTAVQVRTCMLPSATAACTSPISVAAPELEAPLMTVTTSTTSLYAALCVTKTPFKEIAIYAGSGTWTNSMGRQRTGV